MSRNPFRRTSDQTTEYGFGEGRFPDQRWDFSQGGSRSRFPLADPDRNQQLLDLAASRRTDLQNPAEPDLPAFEGGQGPSPMHYALGNTDRYGAQAPLVRERRRPTFRRPKIMARPRMVRSQDTGLAATYTPDQTNAPDLP